MKPYLELGQGLLVPTYFLIISLVTIFGLLWSLRRGAQKKKDPNLILDIYLVLMIGSALGSRILHVIWEAPTYYLENPLKIFAIWEGGFVFYGGALGAFSAGLWMIRHRRLPVLDWLDFFAPVAAATYALGRWGCFLEGCCYGKITDVPWGMHFHSLAESASYFRHPTQLYASAAEFITLLLMLNIEKLHFFKKPGRLFFTWISLHGLGRIIMESFRDDDRGQLIGGFSISWIISLGIVVIGSAFLLHSLWNNQKKNNSI